MNKSLSTAQTVYTRWRWQTEIGREAWNMSQGQAKQMGSSAYAGAFDSAYSLILFLIWVASVAQLPWTNVDRLFLSGNLLHILEPRVQGERKRKSGFCRNGVENNCTNDGTHAHITFLHVGKLVWAKLSLFFRLALSQFLVLSLAKLFFDLMLLRITWYGQ